MTWVLLGCLFWFACDNSDADDAGTRPADAGSSRDAGVTPDAGTLDAGTRDAQPADLGTGDAGGADAGRPDTSLADAATVDSGIARPRPLAYYSFDPADVTGSVASDVSGTGVAYNLNTAAGAPDFTQTGTVGNAGFFNGTSALQGPFTATPTVTVSLWIRETVAPPTSGVTMVVTYAAPNVSWQSWEVRATPSGYTFFAAGGASNRVAEALDATGAALNSWIHLVGVYDGQQARIYRDGVLMDSGVAPVAFGNIPSSVSHDLNVGYSGFNNSLFFTGFVDELAIFAGVLSDSEILDLYEAGRAGQRVVP